MMSNDKSYMFLSLIKFGNRWSFYPYFQSTKIFSIVIYRIFKHWISVSYLSYRIWNKSLIFSTYYSAMYANCTIILKCSNEIFTSRWNDNCITWRKRATMLKLFTIMRNDINNIDKAMSALKLGLCKFIINTTSDIFLFHLEHNEKICWCKRKSEAKQFAFRFF